jgi:hypothetical protein
MSWEGKPAKYQLARIDTLKRELADVEKEFSKVVAADVPPIDEELKKRKLQPIPTAETAEADEDETGDGDAELLAAMRRCLHGEKCELETAMGREADRR